MSDKTQNVLGILAQDATTTPTIHRERKANKAWSADLMARCKAFAEALAKSVVGAQPGKKPFAVYLKRDTGKPNLPNRESADAIIGCTIYHLRAMKSPAIVLQAVQLPEDGFGVFARKPNQKRRRQYAADASF
jgi:hypothetical protein